MDNRKTATERIRGLANEALKDPAQFCTPQRPYQPFSPIEDQLLNSDDYGEILLELLHRFANHRTEDAFCHAAREVLLAKCYEKKSNR